MSGHNGMLGAMDHSASRFHTSTGRTFVPRPPFKRPPSWFATVYAHGATQCASIRSIAAGGIRLDRAFGLQAGDAVTVKLPSQTVASGIVEWSVAGFCGIRFDAPLSADDPALAEA